MIKNSKYTLKLFKFLGDHLYAYYYILKYIYACKVTILSVTYNKIKKIKKNIR
jgi:hypothetical protein